MDPTGDTEQYSKVIKMCLMILVALSLIHSKKQIMAFTWVVVLSLALLGAKGGLFTIATGGGAKVFGPPGSLLSDNNHFATALAMTVPLVRFLQTQVENRWQRRALGMIMVLCTAAALGSYSRGALLAVCAMVLVMWWRGKNRGVGLVVIVLAVVALVAFMPDAWMERMNSIKSHDKDQSAQGRINAWIMAWNAAQHHIVGLGFITYKPEYFAMYSPNPDAVFAAHSIYFQVMGSHGFIGLFIFLGMLFSTWRTAGWLRKHTADIPQARWCYELGAFTQVSLVAFFVGGAFLSLAQFDLPYNLLAIVSAARVWVQTRGWEREEATPPKGAAAGLRPRRARAV
jgi:probable O-glycosylation ligase (exosortase A-associated)